MSVKTQLKEKTEKLNAKRDELFKILDEAGPELDMSKVTSLSGDSHDKVAEIRKLNDELDELGEQVRDLKAVEAAALKKDERGEPTDPAEDPERKDAPVKSLGRAFVESRAFKDYQPGSGVGPIARLDIGIRATLFETGAGWAPESTRTGIVTEFPTRPAPHVVDFIPQVPTGQAAVKYMEETTFTNAGAETAEGAAFPESALVLTERSKTVRKVSTWLPVTDEQFEDVDEAEAYVNNRLVFMLQQRVDLQVIRGNDVAPNVGGTENVTGIQTQALGVDNIPDAIYKLFVLIRSDGFAEPTVVFIQPSKWQNVRLLKTADGIYIWGSPSVPGPFTIWGVPVVETMVPTSTKAVAGDFTTHAGLYVRRGVDVQVSNAHSDFFVNGKQAIRADVRIAMVHYRPKAFGVVTGL